MTLLVANWKLNNDWEDCEHFSARLRELCPAHFGAEAQGTELVICPAYPYLSHLGRLLAESQIFLGAQDVSAFDSGAYTGEVSARMLSDCGADYCIVGHSERRQYFGESAVSLQHKLKLLKCAELIPILCIGEALDVRDAGNAEGFTLNQLAEVRSELAAFEAGGFALAYEPLWAIGSGRNAEPQQAAEMAASIRGWLSRELSAPHAEQCPLLYGGSVKADNIASYLEQAAYNGALVGGASLKAESFAALLAALA